MNRVFIFILAAFFSNLSYSQSYEKIVEPNKMWVVLINSSDAPAFYNGGDSYAYKFQDSTLFEDEYWMKLWESSDSLYSEWNIKGYMKENDSIVLFMDLSNKVYILYDFTKKKGDNIVTEACELPVDSVSITSFIGKDRLTLHVSDHQYYDVKYFEGIGSNAGLLAPLFNCSTGAYRYLLCFYQNGEEKYHNPKFNSCNYNVSSVINRIETTVNIYFNSGKNTLNINNVNANSQLEIYNAIGQLVYSKLLMDSNNELIMPQINSYCIVKLISNDGKIVYSKPLIKW